MGFPGSSAGKESICNARHPGSIPGLWRSAREGIGYPLQHSWTSLVAQLVKNSSAMWQILTFNLTMNVIWIVPSKIADGKKKKGRKGRKNNGRVNEFASVTFFFLFFFFFSLYVGDIYTSTQHLLLDCQSWELSMKHAMDILLLLKEWGRDIYSSITLKIIAWMHAMTELYVFLLVLRISTEKVLRINPGNLSWEESFEVNLLGYQKVFCYIQGIFLMRACELCKFFRA